MQNPGQQESLNINNTAKKYFYYFACYRNFADISKFEWAKRNLRNAGRKRQTDSPCEKEEGKARKSVPIYKTINCNSAYYIGFWIKCFTKVLLDL